MWIFKKYFNRNLAQFAWLENQDNKQVDILNSKAVADEIEETSDYPTIYDSKVNIWEETNASDKETCAGQCLDTPGCYHFKLGVVKSN